MPAVVKSSRKHDEVRAVRSEVTFLVFRPLFFRITLLRSHSPFPNQFPRGNRRPEKPLNSAIFRPQKSKFIDIRVNRIPIGED